MTTAEQNVFVGSVLAMLSRTHVETEGEGRGERGRGRGRERREGVWEVVAPLPKPPNLLGVWRGVSTPPRTSNYCPKESVKNNDSNAKNEEIKK